MRLPVVPLYARGFGVGTSEIGMINAAFFLMAGLLAAFMSTFDSTVNSGAAYVVNDVYKRYIYPDGTAL
jgi:Na+/proline symporter